MIRRINLFGGPSAGKSRTAARLFADLKDYKSINKCNWEVELVREFVKDWAWQKQPIKGWDQLHIFSEQLRREELLLRNGVDFIITDCPIQLNAFYGWHEALPFAKNLIDMAKEYEKQYPSINFVLKRPEIYHEKGRFHNKEEACEIDESLNRFLTFENVVHLDNKDDLKLRVLHIVNSVSQ